ncbi:hypothetical protein [Actinophytocola oryzae]|uniref:hypothetical protein n=1 Tax=Actinophytocola oryzae TaxID=502181 RepID=UPI00312CB757
MAEDPTSRNRPPVRVLPPNAPTSRKPPMALLLRYLITRWGGDRPRAGRGLRARPRLRRRQPEPPGAERGAPGGRRRGDPGRPAWRCAGR